MLHNMEQEFDVYGGVAHGDLSAVTGWLREKVDVYKRQHCDRQYPHTRGGT